MNPMGSGRRGSMWLRDWFGSHGSDAAARLQTLLTRMCRQESALACHLAERARAVRFAPDRGRLEGLAAQDRAHAQALAHELGDEAPLAAAAAPAPRPGTLTASKLIQDLHETEDLAALYRQASRLAPAGTLRSTLEGLAAEEGRGSQMIRGVLARMDSNVTDPQ